MSGSTIRGSGAATGASTASSATLTAHAASDSEAVHDASAALRRRTRYGRPVLIAAGSTASTRLTITNTSPASAARASTLALVSKPTGPIDAARALAASTLPALTAASRHLRPTIRLPATTPAAAVAGPTAGGSSRAATRMGSVARLTFCSGPILTGYFSLTMIPAKHTGTSSQRQGSAMEMPPRAATAASTTPSAGTPTITARSRGLSVPKPPDTLASGYGHVEVGGHDRTSGAVTGGCDLVAVLGRDDVRHRNPPSDLDVNRDERPAVAVGHCRRGSREVRGEVHVVSGHVDHVVHCEVRARGCDQLDRRIRFAPEHHRRGGRCARKRERRGDHHRRQDPGEPHFSPPR